MSSIQDVELLYTTVCDDIRREDNGKFILIGVYPDAIFMNALPAQIQLSLWMNFKMSLTEKISFEFEINGDALQEPLRFTIEIVDEKLFGKSHMIPCIAKLIFNLKNEGSFDIFYKSNSDKKFKFARKVIVKRNNLYINASSSSMN